MAKANFLTEIPASGELSENHRAILWALAASTGPMSLSALTSHLNTASLPCDGGEAHRVRAWLREILADLSESGLIEIDWSKMVAADQASGETANPEDPRVVNPTDEGMKLAAELFIN